MKETAITPIEPGLTEELRLARYDEEQISEITAFLREGNFCRTAQIYIVRLLARAKAGRFPECMALLKDRHLTVWNRNPDRVGDPDDVTTIPEEPPPPPDVPKSTYGLHNTCAFFETYKALGIAVKGLY